MYNASQRLRAIRKQLKSMNDQYQHGLEDSGVGTDDCLLNAEDHLVREREREREREGVQHSLALTYKWALIPSPTYIYFK